jgi:hypothetical protein
MTRYPRNISPPVSRETWRQVATYIIPLLPSTVVYMAQEPLVLWLALTLGGQTPLSETFAVGRIAAIYGILGSFIIVVLTPRLARTADEAHFARLTGFFVVIVVALSAAALIVAHVTPRALLCLLVRNTRICRKK